MQTKVTLVSASPISLDWVIFLSVLLVILLATLLSKNHKRLLRRQKSREIAEKAVKAGEKFWNPERIEVDAKQVEGLDLNELERLTTEFEGLGFVRVWDYRLKFKDRQDLHGFARALVHRELFCSGEIMAMQASLEDKGPLLIGLGSALSDDWRVSSINRKASKVDYFDRRPKSIRLMRNGATPRQLFERHMEVRNMLVQDLGLRVDTDISLETKYKRIAKMLVERREALLRCDILAEMDDAKSVAEEEEWEWLGDYPQEKIRQLKGNRLPVIPENFPVYKVPQKEAVQQMSKAPEASTDEDPRV